MMASLPLVHAPGTLDQVIATQELLRRPLRAVNVVGESAAFEALSGSWHEGTTAVLRRLSKLGVQLCAAGTAGVSVLEPGADGSEIFRWRALAGTLERHEGGSTPRDWSPCGSCLDAGKPMLYAYPARYFTYFANLPIPITEGLVIPVFSAGRGVATIWIVSHDESHRFDAEDVRVMTSLSGFVEAALRRDTEAVMPAGTADAARPETADGLWQHYLRRIAEGEQSALSALYNETSPLVFTAALRILGFRADAEEVVVDVYSQVWQTAQRYDAARGTVRSWLGMLARSRSFDYLRARGSQVVDAHSLARESYSGMDPENSAAAAQQRDRLRSALLTLPREQRRAIELAYQSGLTAIEIAQRLGEPVGTIKTRIRLGLVKLRRLLATAG